MTLADRRHVPNALTILRLVLAAAFFGLISLYRYPGHHQLWANVAIGVFITAVITDGLDGYLARRWKVVSVFGRVMDPFCDKVLILGAFIFLASPRFAVPEWVAEDRTWTMSTGVYAWMVVLILARELLVTGIRGVVESRGVSFAARRSGKWKMVIQSVGIPVIIFITVNVGVEQSWALWCNTVVVYLTLLMTLWSGIPYVLGAPQALAGIEE